MVSGGRFPVDKNGMVTRRPVPTFAWVLSGGTAFGLLVATLSLTTRGGTAWFYVEGDAFHYQLIARDLFGSGHGFVFHSEAAYRYGRFGFPFVSWLLALGRPALVGWTLIGVNLLAIAAIPGLAATYVDAYGVPAMFGAVVLLPASILTLYNDPVADPLMIALILFAFLLDARGYRTRALVSLACAVLVKEVAAVALLPWMWQAIRRRNRKEVGQLLCVLVPYLAWATWVRIRVGEFPFLAHTLQRREAFGLPFAGMRTVWHEQPPHYLSTLALTIVTIVVAFVAAWIGRRHAIAGVSAAFGCVVLCFGPNALRFSFEIGRLLAPAQVFALVTIALVAPERWPRLVQAANRPSRAGVDAR
jgi:hypothetical protein